jgi:hypothetical protein
VAANPESFPFAYSEAQAWLGGIRRFVPLSPRTAEARQILVNALTLDSVELWSARVAMKVADVAIGIKR